MKSNLFNSNPPPAANLSNTWYHTSAIRPPLTDNLRSVNQKFDFIIIGGGFTGISAALKLAQSGAQVILFEQYEIGSGASGRNGGLVCSGFRHDQKWFEDKLGKPAAKQIWDVSEAAKKHLENNISKYEISADYEKGLLFAAHSKSMLDWIHEDARHLQQNYDYDSLKPLNQEECEQALGTNSYLGGVRDDGAGRIHPLKYLYGLATAAKNAGAILFENCRVDKVIENGANIEVVTPHGNFSAPKIILCGDGYLSGINPDIEAKVMPIGSFMIATQPIDAPIMQGAIGAMDTRFVVNYFQRTTDNRFLFGGGEKYTPKWPNDIASFVRNNFAKIYPQYKDIEITHAWGGTLGITPTRLPFVRQLSKRILVSAGYSGQGVLLAPFFGDILGRLALDEKNSQQIIEKLPIPNFPGGRLFRFPLLSAAMTYYSMLDKLP